MVARVPPVAVGVEALYIQSAVRAAPRMQDRAMNAERHERPALFLIGAMALGLMGGGAAFPQVAFMLGDTVAAWCFAIAGMVIAGSAHELVRTINRTGRTAGR